MRDGGSTPRSLSGAIRHLHTAYEVVCSESGENINWGPAGDVVTSSSSVASSSSTSSSSEEEEELESVSLPDKEPTSSS